MQSVQKKMKTEFWTENMFFIFLGLYTFYLTLRTTLFHLGLPAKIELLLFWCLVILVVFRIILLLILHKHEYRRILPMLSFSLLVALIWMLVYRNDGYFFLRFLAVLTVGCIGLDYRKVLKIYVVVVGFTVLTAVICALGEAIANLVYNNLSTLRLRSSWGIIYPTDFSAYLIYLCIAAWIGWRELPDWFFLFPGTFAFLISFFIARSYTGSFSCILFLIVITIHIIIKSRSMLRLQKLVDLASTAAFPMFGIIMIGFTWLYHRGNRLADRINTLNHSRFYYPSKAYDNYGLHLFGAPLTQIGGGGSTFSFQNPDYNFVDCTYLLVLLRYGIITLAMLTLLWILMTRHAAKIRDRRLMLGLALIALHSISEHHFTELNYNILLVLPFSVLFASPIKAQYIRTNRSDAADISNRPVAAVIVVVLGLILPGIFCLPKLLSCFRTLCSVLEMDSGVYHQRALFLGVVVFLLFLLFVIRCLFQTVLSLLCRRRPARHISIVLIFVTVCMILGSIGIHVVLRRSAAQQRDLLESDRTAIEALISAGDPVYVSKVPELYDQTFGGIRSTVYATEDLARLRGVSILVDADFDSEVFVSRGFLYAEISDKHAVYTNSYDSIQALSNAGFHLTGYYSRCLSVDLERSASLNSLPFPGDGSILLSSDRSLRHGPYLNLLKSPYTVSFDLSLQTVDGSPLPLLDGNTSICALRVSSRRGKNVIKEEHVRFDQFTGEDILTVNVNCTIPKVTGVEFLIFPQIENITVVVHAIRFQKTPANDTHMTFNQKWQKIHEAYFDLSGKPVISEAGYASRDFAYDRHNNLILERYYDPDGNPVVNNSGYSEVRRIFNFKKQVTRIDYFDPYGNPAVLSSGYSSTEREYDSEGNLSVQHFFDAKNQPVLRSEGYSTLVREFNKKKQIIHEAYFGTDSAPIAISSGYYAVKYGYDEAGNRNLICYYDSNSQPFTLSAGYAELHRIFNVNRQIIRAEYFDAAGKPVLRREGYSAEEYDRDSAGNVIVNRYYGLDGKLTLCSSGYAELHRVFNNQNKVIREEYFGTDGMPIQSVGGYSVIVRQYDSQGNLTKKIYFNLLGNEVIPAS